MINETVFSFMKSEFTGACMKIDFLAADAQQKCIQRAFEALKNGDLAERDRQLEKADQADVAAMEAKIEVWKRISEKYGIAPNRIEELLARAHPHAEE